MNKQNQGLPYLPKDRKILYVGPDNKFMKEAAKMLAGSGCVKQPTAAVIVLNGKVIARGVNAGKRVDVCPRVTRGCPTGTGYEFCKTVCQPCWNEIIRAGIAKVFLRKDSMELYKK